MSTMALVARVRADKDVIAEAHKAGLLYPAKARSLGHVPVDVVDYTAGDPDLTDDEHQMLRNTIESWMAKGRHESHAVAP